MLFLLYCDITVINENPFVTQGIADMYILMPEFDIVNHLGVSWDTIG